MGFVDFILNLAGLLLWMNWRSTRLDPLRRTSASSLAGTLRRADPPRMRRWHYLVALPLLLIVRAFVYQQLGAAVNWTPMIHLGAISVAFRSYYLDLMLLFSFLSFFQVWLVFHFWLLLFSLINRRDDLDPVQKLVRWHLGLVDRFPWWVKLALPWLVTGLAWVGLQPLLAHAELMPPVDSWAHRLQQAALLGLGAYLSWRYVLGVILALYLLGSYVYLGKHPLMDFIALSGRNLLRPFRVIPFMTIGKVDIAPVIALALFFFIFFGLESLLPALFPKLPF